MEKEETINNQMKEELKDKIESVRNAIKGLESEVKVIGKDTKNLHKFKEELNQFSKRNIAEMRKEFSIENSNPSTMKFFETTKDIEFKDGSKIKKGSEFLIEKINGDKASIHFAVDDENNYSNSTGEYKDLNLKDILKFSQPTNDTILKNEIDKVELLYKAVVSERDYLKSEIAVSKFGESKDEIVKFLDENKVPSVLRNDEAFLNTVAERVELQSKLNDLDVKEYEDAIGRIEVLDLEIEYKIMDEGSDRYEKSLEDQSDKYYEELWHKEKTIEHSNIVKPIFVEKNHEIEHIGNDFIMGETIMESEQKGVSAKGVLNLVSEKALDRIEKIIETVNAVKLDIRPVQGKFDFQHINDINKSIYGGIYELPRVSKEKMEACKNILNDLKNEELNKVKNVQEFAEKVSNHIPAIHKLEMFEKGNASTVKEFTKSLAKKSGFDIDLSKVPNQYFDHICKNKDKLTSFIVDNAKNNEPLKSISKVFDKMIGLER